MIKELEDSILKVFGKDGQELEYNKKEIKFFYSKYSSCGKPSLTLFLDERPLVNARKNKYKVQYKCKCGQISTIHLSKFLKKEKLTCSGCRETEEKKKWHSEVLKRLHKGIGYESKRKHQNVIYNFEAEDENFKRKYYSNNLTQSEFNHIKKYLFAIDGVCVENKDIIFNEYDISKNAKKYRQTVVIDGKKHPFKRIVLKCPLCGSTFSISRPIKHRVIANNFDCKYCYLTNKTFAIKVLESGLTYQSKMELQFINECQQRGIDVLNGADIKYYFNNGYHSYRVDYFLPHYKLQVELKDNHVWHRQQVESGKWKAKEQAAQDFCKTQNMHFVLLFPQDFEQFFLNLERDSLNNGESH